MPWRRDAAFAQEERVEQVANRFEEKIARSTELRQQHIAGIVQVRVLG